MAWSVMRRAAAAAALLAATLFLAGCNAGVEDLSILSTASSSDEDDATSVGTKKIGKPYKVGGRWYTPGHDEDYDKVGLASWYGPKFHGKSTANGEAFDQHALTAAHPTLPLPSYVRVTVVKTGKSAVLRVNDRGPFHRGRIIDVSKAAADKLGFRRAGSAKVRVEYLADAEIGGGDKETLMAEAKFGKSSSKSLRDYLPFGGSSSDTPKKKDAVEVRLAAAKPRAERNADEERANASSNLPGVRLKERFDPTDTTQLASSQIQSQRVIQAYAPEETTNDGAIEAVIAMRPPVSLEEEEPVVTAEATEAVSEETVAASQSRVTGAFDVFGTAGGGSSAPLQSTAAPE